MTNESWPSTHISLLMRVQEPQSADGWTEFVAQYRGPIVRLCTGVFKLQEAKAQDIAQEVLVKLLREMQRFEYKPEKSFRGWLKTVTKNALRDYVKKEQRRIDSGTGDSEIHQFIKNFARTESASELADTLSRELQQGLYEEAEQLVRQRVDEQTWQAYRARMDGIPAKEIATKLEMKVAAVHKAKSRVGQMLREEIAVMLTQQR